MRRTAPGRREHRWGYPGEGTKEEGRARGAGTLKSCTEWTPKAASNRDRSLKRRRGRGRPPAVPTLLRRMLILLPFALHLSDAMPPAPGTSSARFLQLQCTFASLQGGGQGPQCKPKAHSAE